MQKILSFVFVTSFLISCTQPSSPTPDTAEPIQQPPTTESITSTFTCPLTVPQVPVFVPPAPYDSLNSFKDHFWFGSNALWTIIPSNGMWGSLPLNPSGYTQKILWWREGYVWDQEPEPNLVVTGERLDESAPALIVSKATNAYASVVVSLAPNIPLSALASGLGTPRVARMIPNAPSIIGRGFNPVTFGDGLDADARQDLSALFAPWGAWPEVPERDLEAYAILTGMGPTYYWYQWQALRDVAVQFGLSSERADEALPGQMLDGALATLLQSGLPPAGVMDLIPVRPLQAIEESVTAAYGTALPALYATIRPTV